MTKHELKTWPEPYAALLDGRKRFEIRKDDRGFEVGDELTLREWSPYPVTGGGDYTGRVLTVRVTYISRAPDWGLSGDVVVMGIEPTEGAERGSEMEGPNHG